MECNDYRMITNQIVIVETLEAFYVIMGLILEKSTVIIHFQAETISQLTGKFHSRKLGF